MPKRGAIQREFEEQFEPILRTAFGVALRLTKNRDDAQDLVQEASVQAFRAYDSFRRGTNFKAWFLKILTNLFLNNYRKKQHEPDTTELDDVTELTLYARAKRAGVEGKGADPAALIMSRIESAQVASAIDALPDEYRVAATLYFIEELSYQEIADLIDCPIGTVRSRLHRGRKILQQSLWELAEPHFTKGAKRTGESS